MTTLDPLARCSDAALAELVTPYCFGDADESQRRAFELHLMECDVCWREVQRLDAAVGALRTDMSLAHTLTVPEISGLLGLSAALDRPFAGHGRYVVAVSALLGVLFALPVLVEIAWRWSVYGGAALVAAPIVWAWMTAAGVAALAVGIRSARQGGGGVAVSILVLLAATIVVCAVLTPFAPAERLVEARFQTYPVALGYVKGVVHAWLVAPVFVLWPTLFVVAMQRQLAAGRHRAVLRLLTGAPDGIAPPGVRYPRLVGLVAWLGAVTLYNWLGMAHLFDNLLPGPHTRLFMGLVMTKSALWFALPVACLWWYAGCLTELKRECLAVVSFVDGDDRRS